MTETSTTILVPTIRWALGADDDALEDDGSVVWLGDHVHVVMGRRVPVRLRGVMFDVTQEKRQSGALDLSPALYRPAHGRLMGHVPEAR